MFIPRYPAKAENTAPIKNEMAITGLEVSTDIPDHTKSITAMTAK
jgi:hypothetical protein